MLRNFFVLTHSISTGSSWPIGEIYFSVATKAVSVFVGFIKTKLLRGCQIKR